MAAAEGISVDAAAAAVYSELDGIFMLNYNTETGTGGLDMWACFYLTLKLVEHLGARRLATGSATRLTWRSKNDGIGPLERDRQFVQSPSKLSALFPNAFHGLCSTQIHETTPKDLGNVPFARFVDGKPQTDVSFFRRF